MSTTRSTEPLRRVSTGRGAVAGKYVSRPKLARRLLAGDETVLHDLETDVWPGISRRILRRFPGLILSADLPDLIQETRLAFWRGRRKYDTSKGSVPSWFAGIGFNKAKEWAKRERVQRHRRGRGSRVLPESRG